MELAVGIGTISLVSLFAVVAIVAIVFLFIYAGRWNNSQTITASNSFSYDQKTKTQFAYYGAVIALLFVLAGMHGYGLIKELL